MAVTGQSDTMYAGNPRVLQFTVSDEDNGGLLDLTGKVVKFALARIGPTGPVKNNPLVDKSSASSSDVIIVDAAAGRVDVTLVPADTSLLADAGDTTYYFELEVFDGANGVVVATGQELIKRNVTNA